MKTTYKALNLVLFPGFYNTIFEPHPDEYILSEYYDLDKIDMNDLWDYWDNESYERDVCEQFVDMFAGELQRIFGKEVIDVAYHGVDSPSYYNYRNDNLLVDITVADEHKFLCLMLDWVDKHEEYVAKCLKRDFTSYPGFIPFHSNDLDTFLSEMDYGNPEWMFLLCYIAAYDFQDPEYDFAMVAYETSEIFLENYFNVPDEIRL